MCSIKHTPRQKYHSYALTEELPVLTQAALTCREKDRNFQNNSRLLRLTQQMSEKRQYLYLDMQQQGQFVKMLEREPTIQSQQDEEEAEKYGNKYIHELYNLSPANKNTLQYLKESRRDTEKRDALRVAVKKRINELMNPEGDRLPSSTQNRVAGRFLLLPSKRTSRFDASLDAKKLQLIRKFGIVEDYCFLDRKEETPPRIIRPVRPIKHMSTISTRRATEDMSTLTPRVMPKLPEVERTRQLKKPPSSLN